MLVSRNISALLLLALAAVSSQACGSAASIDLLPAAGGAGGSHGGCTSNANCTAQLPLCDTQSGSCVQCLAASDCTTGQTCNLDIHRCALRCTSNANCTTTSQPYCDTTRGLCVGCLANTNCASDTPYCDTSAGTCVACLNDSGCAATDKPHCNLTSHQCVECLQNSQCTSGTCVNFECQG